LAELAEEEEGAPLPVVVAGVEGPDGDDDGAECD
jgi:hypothetical protein